MDSCSPDEHRLGKVSNENIYLYLRYAELTELTAYQSIFSLQLHFHVSELIEAYFQVSKN